MSRKTFINLALITAGLIGWKISTGNSDKDAAKKPKPPALVEVASVVAGSLPIRIEATGLVQAQDSVDIRPQVTGIVQQIRVQEGQQVKAGDVLFVLDDAVQQADVGRARAQENRDQVLLKDSERNLNRNRDLQAKGFVSASGLESAQASSESQRASLAANQAARKTAEATLAQRVIRAGFAGRVGLINVAVGSQVQPGMAPAMTNLTRLDPISVVLNVADKHLPALQQALHAGKASVQITDPALNGQLNQVDNQIDTQTGTIKVRARFANTDGRLWPGLQVSAQIEAGLLLAGLLVPASGVQTGPDGQFAYVLQADNKVKAQPLTLVSIQNDTALVTGLQAGAQVVINGALNIRPGDPVRLAKDKPSATAKGK